MKKIISLFSVLLVLLLSVSSAFAYQVQEESILGQFRKNAGSVITSDDYVLDLADLLTDSEEEELYERAKYIADTYSCGVYMLTVPDMGDFGYTYVESFSEDWFDTMGYGEGGSLNGVLLVLTMASREYDVDAHGNFGNNSFTDYGKEVMAERFLPYFGEGDWFGGFSSFYSTSEEFLERSWNGEPFDIGDSMLTYGERLRMACPVAAVIAGIIALVSVLIMKRGMNTARQANEASQYVVPGSIVLNKRLDRFTHATETRVRKSTQSKGGGMGGTSINSGGHSHSSGHF